MDIPLPIERFLIALEAGDHAALQSALSAEAVLIEGERAFRGEAIVAWLDRFALRGITTLRPIRKAARDGEVILTVFSVERSARAGDTEAHRNWCFRLGSDCVATVRIEEQPMPELPPVVSNYVRATNRFDLDGLVATFAEGALVNDQLRDYWGKDAIRQWAARDIVGKRLTMFVSEVVEHHGHVIVTAAIDGDFDKRGLPEPLVLAFYFSAAAGEIVQLIILRNFAGI